MVFPNIEKIKQDYTDKYVVVDTRRPELARFADYTGVVKTVNMSGRALVEFMDYNVNIGWFDIDLDYLKVVDQPIVREKKAAAKPAAEKPAASAEKKPAKAAAGGKPSTADILAKLRGGGGAAPAKPAAAAAQKAAPKAGEPASAGGGKVDRSKMSVAEMIALARNKDAGGDSAAAEPEHEPAATEEPVAEAAPTPKAASGEIVKLDRSSMTVDEMVAYCREHDAS